MTYRAKRRIVRIILFVLLFIIPFLKIGGNPALRFDIKGMSIYVLGVSLSPSHIFPIALIIFACLFFFIFATQLYGRLWCGWLCPQTNWLEMAADLSVTFSKKDSKAVAKVKKLVNMLIKLLVSFVFTVGLALYFVAPQDLLQISHIIAIVTLIIFLEITFVGRLFCKTVCPYSNFQSVMYDADTMRVALLPDRADACINCKACVRVCPTGLDIREGLSNKCVLCASCVDACTVIMAKLGKKTCVDYMFGRQRLNLLTPNKIITFLIAVLFLLAGAVSFSRIGGLSVHAGDIVYDSGAYRFELIVKSTFPEMTVVQVHGGRENHALTLPRHPYTLNKGESVAVPVAVSGKTRDNTVKLTVKFYQGRKESIKDIVVELNK